MLLIGVAVAAALLFVGGATARGTGASTALVPTAAGADRYLSSLGLDPAGFVVQHGSRNYAGAKCPGKGWSCTKAKRVLQIATGGGVNAVVCSASGGSASSSAGTGSVGCTIVQASTSGSNTATCSEQSSGDIGALTQSCKITQTSGTGNNTANVVQGFQQGPSACSPPSGNTSYQTQSGTQLVTVTQGSAAGSETANVTQSVSQCASTTGANAAQTQTTDQEFTIQQGPVNFSPPSCGADTGAITATASQSQHQRAYATSATGGSQSQHADLIGHVDQCSAGQAQYTATQNEDQYLPMNTNVAQQQVGPTSLTGLPKVHGKRTLLRGQCCSFQGTNANDTCTIKQTTSQMANANATQTESLSASAATSGSCNGNVDATENGHSFSSSQSDTQSLDTGLTCAGQSCTGTQVPTTLVWSGDTSTHYHDMVRLAATLLTQTATPTAVPNANVSLSAGGESCPAVTNSVGIASCLVQVTDAPGSFSTGAAFGGNSSFLASTAPVVGFTISPAPTTVTYTGVHAADYSDPAALSATLVETDTGNAVDATPSPRSIKFTLGSQTCSSSVAGKNAACTLIVDQPSASTTVNGSFAGDAFYAPSSDSDPFTITQEENSLSYTGPTSAKQGSKVTLTAKLAHGSTPLANRTLTFKLGTQTCTPSTPTNASGIASCTLTLTQPPKGYTVTVTFGGDPFYQSNSASKAFTIKS